MMHISQKQLRDRWTNKEVEPLRRYLPISGPPRVQDNGHPFLALPRDGIATIEHDGRSFLDLRGFPLGSVAFLHDRDVDFSFATAHRDSPNGINVYESKLFHYRFDHVHGIFRLQSDCTNCSFVGAGIERGSIRGNFEDCCFDDAKLNGTSAHESHFLRCSFRNADLRTASFGNSTFEHCDLRGAHFGSNSILAILRGMHFGSGSILATRFLSCNLTDVDLADAMRDEATFFDLGCTMDGLRFAMTTRVFFLIKTDVGPAPVKRENP